MERERLNVAEPTASSGRERQIIIEDATIDGWNEKCAVSFAKDIGGGQLHARAGRHTVVSLCGGRHVEESGCCPRRQRGRHESERENLRVDKNRVGARQGTLQSRW